MALGRDVVDAIIREHAYRPITGDVLLIGQQAVTLSGDEVLELMREHDVAAAAGDMQAAAGDLQHAANADTGGMSAAAFFTLLGVDRLHMLDIGSAGEDSYFSEPLPDRLEASTDFIIDGGALTDIFSPAAVLRNYARALRPGGRLIAVNNLSAHFDPYSIPTASWYLDYCVINGFADAKVYVLDYPPGQPVRAFCLDIDCLLDPAGEIRAFLSPHETAVILFAEKGAASTTDGCRPTPICARVTSGSAIGKISPGSSARRAPTWCAPASSRASSSFAAAIFSCARIIARSTRRHWSCALTTPRSRRRYCRRCRRTSPARHRHRS